VKRFLKEPGGVDQYPDVTIKWIRHHNPDLDIFVNGAKTRTIDLSRYTTSGLHELFSQHFVRRGARAAAGRALSDDSTNSSAAVGSGPSIVPPATTTQSTTTSPAASAASASAASTSDSTAPTPPLRSDDVALPKPAWRQAADAPFAASPLTSDATAILTAPPLTPTAVLGLITGSVLAVAMLARCILRQRQRLPKAKADAV